jgi:hypothetical protein
MAKLPDQPIKPVSRRPRLVAKRQLTVFGRKFGDELARRFRGVDLTEICFETSDDLLDVVRSTWAGMLRARRLVVDHAAQWHILSRKARPCAPPASRQP